MNMKLMSAGLFAGLMMAGSALAMDSAVVKEHMEKINEDYIKTSEEEGKVQALEERIKELEEMIQSFSRTMNPKQYQ
ncbi:hypothetical protein [Halomonas daqiaonensis]|uniref:Adhesion protein FadA n=1 Tax=Halomonas daqiaonensis TaxID=650850 RepID=A0A1H7MC09_9GAMM|nr:hypothetical protein [Halomonas daqiaonensis]SEL08816.1 hypothetical protein SAMN04488129_106200 [Halomonas daqiaonensis]